MNIGATIKKYRLASNMEQKDLGALLGVSAKTISSWEVNRTQPKMGKIEEMCKILNCKKSDFLGEEPQDQIIISTPASLNKEEEQIIVKYRLASEDIKNSVCKILDIQRLDKSKRIPKPISVYVDVKNSSPHQPIYNSDFLNAPTKNNELHQKRIRALKKARICIKRNKT